MSAVDEAEMNDIDHDDNKDDAEVFLRDIEEELQNETYGAGKMEPEIATETGGTTGKKRARCWKHFEVVTKENDVNPRAKCKWCDNTIACHLKRNGTHSMNEHLAKVCPKFPMSKRFMGSRQKLLSFQKVEGRDGETNSNLVSVTFSADSCKRALAVMMIMDELPFSFVEVEGFKHFISVVQPRWTPPGRITMAKQCMLIYEDEKKALKRILKNQRLCLTTDTWTSVQNLNYMCLTGHYIDESWRYQKKILNFRVVSSHKGDVLGKIVDQCLLEWGIDKILTVTVDNASSNNLLIAYLQRAGKDNNSAVLQHEFMHVRCSAHVLNLIVREGLQEIEASIGRVRNIVRYVRSSPQRTAEFWSFVHQARIECRLKPVLDVSTRWNSTYFMLERAVTYQRAFNLLCDEPGFKISVQEEEMNVEFNDFEEFEGLGRIVKIEERGKKKKKVRRGKEHVGAPNSSDWGKVKLYVQFLRVFYEATLKFSGSLYVTCNSFFDEMVVIQQEIMELCENNDKELRELALAMLGKFDKYWGSFEKINSMMLYAVVLDPRCKVDFFEYCFVSTLQFDKNVVEEWIDKIRSGITRLFEWYDKNEKNKASSNSKEVGGSSDQAEMDGGAGHHKSLKSQFRMHKQKETNMAGKTELQKYLLESCEEECDGFDVLHWWKVNSPKYPILSQVARDVLVIPVSTVASESAFSTGGRVIDPYRSSLSPKTVEALICTQQWMRRPQKINIRAQLDSLDELDNLDSVLESTGSN